MDGGGRWKRSAQRSLLNGSVTNLCVAAMAAWCGRQEHGRTITPVNAISHILWGDQAAATNDVSWKYTGAGLALNEAACVFWALLYEALAQRRTTGPARRVLYGAGVAALAYVTDYHLIPRRFTPGFELHLPRRRFLPIYAGLAAGLLVGGRLACGIGRSRDSA
jgi:hypothetical protein